MKLAVVSETFPPEVNGVAMTIGVIARELSKLGHEVTVYRPWRDDHVVNDSGLPFREVTMAGMRLPALFYLPIWMELSTLPVHPYPLL